VVGVLAVRRFAASVLKGASPLLADFGSTIGHMRPLTLALAGLSFVSLLIGVAYLTSVRTHYYEKYGSYSPGRRNFFESAFAERRRSIVRAIFAFAVGFGTMLLIAVVGWATGR